MPEASEWRAKFMKDDELREMVIKFLSTRPKNTAEIKTLLREKNSEKSGIEIAMMLESDPEVVRIGTVRKSGIVDSDTPLSEWATHKWVEENRGITKNI